MKIKFYTIVAIGSLGSTRTYHGTLPQLAYCCNYTLNLGASYKNSKFPVKVVPKTITTLLKSLRNAVIVSDRCFHNEVSYTLKGS